jgi:phage terminase large subunit
MTGESSNFDVSAQRIGEWRRDAVQFVRDVFNVEPDIWQLEALRSYSANKPRIRLGMQACAGPGKSAVLAWIGWHALLCHADKQRHPNGYATSITDDNLKDGLWKEMAVWHNRSKLLLAAFTWQKERIFAKHHPETWFLSKRTFSKSADMEAQGRTLSGAHAPFIFYLIDESGEMPPSVLRAAEQGLSNCEWGCIATAYNPTSHVGIGYQVSNDQSHMWDVIRITGDPDDPRRSQRIDLEWARQQIKLYGRDNPWVMAYILGQFPPTAINALLSPDEVRTSMERTLPDHTYRNVQKRLGIDVARFGDDRTVIFPRHGRRAVDPIVLRNADTLVIAARVVVEKERFSSEREMIDNSGGWAAGVIDQCKLGGLHLFPVDSSAPANDPRYFNRRSELKFLSAAWVKSGGWLPNVPELIREFTAETYWFEGGKLRVEEKALVKKRLGYSPDLKDAFDYTFALPDMPAQAHQMIGMRGQPARKNESIHEYNPLEELV